MFSDQERFKHLQSRVTHACQRLIWRCRRFMAPESLRRLSPLLVVLLAIAGAVLAIAPVRSAIIFFSIIAAIGLAIEIVIAIERRRNAGSLGPKLRYRIRVGRTQDAERIYQTLCDSFPAENDRDELTPREVFAAWLDTKKVQYRLIETVDHKNRVHQLKGFYSIHPLTEKAYEDLKCSRLLHDDVADEHLASMNVDASGTSSVEDIVLFILDLETTRQGMDRKAAAYLLVDLLEQIRRAISSNRIRFVAALGASKEGKYWCEKLGLKRVSDYFVADYDEWGIYETPRASIGSYIKTLLDDGWPLSIRNARYPYEVDKQIDQARCILNESLSKLRTKRPRKSLPREQPPKLASP